MSFTNPNPNEPRFPFSGGTDNPGDNTAIAGGGVQIETGAPPLNPIRPPILGVPGASDTVLPAGMQAVPLTSTGFESAVDRGVDPGGPDPVTGRVPGQDETVGETETSPAQSPAAFPEPNP